MEGSRFESIRNSVTVRREEIQPERCECAEKLYQWALVHCAEALSAASLIRIAQAMLMLQKRYFEIRANSTKPHRYLMKPDAGHTCLFQVYEEFYQKLLDAELSLAPPQLYIPPPQPLPQPAIPPPQPAPPEYNGVILGEIVER